MADELNVEKLLQIMNRHVPAKRSSLSKLLEEDEPGYTGKDGTVYRMKREELERIAELVYEWELGKLRLPIYITTDTSYPGGAWKVRGRMEVKVISQLIGREPEKEDEMRLFFPHVNDVRSLLPTTTSILFMP